MTDRSAIVQAARALIGTPWRHLGRDGACGVDCIGFAIECALGAGCIGEPPAVGAYPRLADPQELLRWCDAHLAPVAKAQAREGDLAVLRVRGSAHVGILGPLRNGRRTLIHAYAEARRVVEHELDDRWMGWIIATYRLPGVED
jgi:hypothetical protein